ncbi:hypothetical protein FB471_6557 [Amycolatopsis cihanbeyliensis]|uniref:Uncharacterized protein n=1 Tax=Amycolatopsis cihanbeyliensis TaxID=1128664 RepID=A0A542CU88_AMYCI|nr:hypothetical protein FB471_6557 [Amycolatopsis cihanbeyliensis]
MRDTRSFVQYFRRTFAETSRRMLTPNEIIAAWEQFVESCEEGYGDILEEYENDRAIRNQIEHLLNDRELNAHEEAGWFRSAITAIDDRFKSLLQDTLLPCREGRPWWEARAPRYAGSELAADFRSQYGIEVRAVD